MSAPKKIEPEKLRGRLFRSFAVGALFSALAVASFVGVGQGGRTDGVPSLLRNGLQWNQKVWSSYWSDSRLVESPPVRPGKKARINGDLGLLSPVELESYVIHVESGDRKVEVPVAELKMMPKTGYNSNFYCIEGWSDPNEYAGVRFSRFMDALKIGKKSDGAYYRYVGLETPDHAYYVSIDMDSMLHPQTLLSYEMNGQPLALKNGAPIRLVIPIKYGIKNLKRIGRIFFSDERPRDYWAEQGYDWYSGL